MNMDDYNDMIKKGLIGLESICTIRDRLNRTLNIILSHPYKIEGEYYAGRILDSQIMAAPATLKGYAMMINKLDERLN